MTDARKNLLLFFDRPTEPCFMQKGDERVAFSVPDHFYPEKYKPVSTALASRFGDDERTVTVDNIALPNLIEPLKMKYNEQFSLFLESHRKMAGHLISVLLGIREDDMQSVCAYCQLNINPYMFNYCLSVALLHRDETKGLDFPTLAETFPHKFMDSKLFRRAREVSALLPSGTRPPITIPVNQTASNAEPEQRVAYFREDIGINLHHWHWHLVYPFDGDRDVVNKDRRGELFYYMHQQIVARYNLERLCNNLGLVTRYNDFRAPIAEAYFPKLDSSVASRAWPPRFAGTTISELDRPVEEIKIDVEQLEIWRDRFIQAIENNRIVLTNGSTLELTEATGIDILGDLMESSILSKNRTFYGDLHNMGHVFLAYAHDPDYSHLERHGVMGDSATAMRDPIFYRWHAYIDDIFNLYKSKLPPYPANKLDFPGISVNSISVEGSAGNNLFATQWEQSTVELSRGLDFAPRGSVTARFTHLQHEEFTYVIQVNNSSGRAVEGAFRIFMAPTTDDRGQPLRFEDQRRLMIELDKFSQPLKAGSNTIRRNSVDSSVTIPYERTFRNQSERPGESGTATAAGFDFCGCGWPHHMLIPKGTQEGFQVVLFCMVSNWAEDKVQQNTVGSCNDAASYCGIRNRKYPDKRPMGFPFDRPARVGTLSAFLRPNMAVRNCSIRFTDATRVRPQLQ